ncbi:hypothetical protein E2562_019736 [Oryza meyeriana var. granulata]|uniref:Uncharacterized protein n=1 Tax=Oryza meyeriana var. granulata TaxID=110450 RepID=A0A6G1C8Y7_9ORYZ|nr:hypothetical protein E2562_019736 [Oryza meyeriana var. granulata]
MRRRKARQATGHRNRRELGQGFGPWVCGGGKRERRGEAHRGRGKTGGTAAAMVPGLGSSSIWSSSARIGYGLERRQGGSSCVGRVMSRCGASSQSSCWAWRKNVAQRRGRLGLGLEQGRVGVAVYRWEEACHDEEEGRWS